MREYDVPYIPETIGPKEKPIHLCYVEHDVRYADYLEAYEQSIRDMLGRIDPSKKVATLVENSSGTKKESVFATYLFNQGAPLGTIYPAFDNQYVKAIFDRLDGLNDEFPGRIVYFPEFANDEILRLRRLSDSAQKDKKTKRHSLFPFFQASIEHTTKEMRHIILQETEMLLLLQALFFQMMKSEDLLAYLEHCIQG